MRCSTVRIVLLVVIGFARSASGQPTPAGSRQPDDTPSIRIGALIFANYTYQTEPRVVDADGNEVNRNAFDITRAYINVTGNISHIVAFRITPDVFRETNPASSGSGSLQFRIKYAYLQANLGDWMTEGSYARFGIQQTPYLDYTEGIYRYRFQGTTFVERTNYFASADAGVSFQWNFPANYGDVHVGVFNGENANKAEVNDQKAIMFRASVRPFAAMAPTLRGLRAAVFYDGDNADRTRAIGQVTFEHLHAVVGFEYLSAKDATTAARTPTESSGYSIWLTPRLAAGWEALLRRDHLTPNTIAALDSQKQNRTIAGVAYWFPHQGHVSTALMLDYDAESFKNISTTPTKTVAVHALVNF
jgi:hypothetical protein